MTIHFRRLELKDWLVYGNDESIELPQFEPNRNLIVVNGPNGYGKTSLLRALQFVFHGLSQAELPDLWNDQAKQNGNGTLQVTLSFQHAGQDWKLIRWADFEPLGSTFKVRSNVRLIIAGEERGQVDDHIAQILPKDCQQFAFFDGAEIQRYARKQQEKGVKDAIERVLGIPAIRNLRLDLSRLVEDLEVEQAELIGSSTQADQLAAAIYALEEERKTYETRKAELVERKEGIEAMLLESEKEAAQIEVISAEFEKLRGKKSRKADLEEKLRDVDQQIQEYIAQAPLHMLLPVLREITAAIEAKLDRPLPTVSLEARKLLLEEILSKDVCICLRSLDEASEKHVRRELERIAALLKGQKPGDQPGGGLDRETRSVLSLVDRLRSTSFKSQDLIDRRALLDTQIEEIDKDIHELQKKLEGHEQLDVQEIFRKQGVLRHQLDETKDQLDAIEKNLGRTTQELEGKRREQDGLAVGTERGKQLTQVLDTARRAQKAVSEYVEELVQERRRTVEKLTSDMFKEITNKPVEYSSVRVKEDYTLEVCRQDGSVVENEKLSAGEKEVLAYSFMTALNLSSPNPAPFVMDTPFGHLDAHHRDGLLKSLPRLKVQVFLLATDRDLPESEREHIAPHIAKEFYIRRDENRAISYFEEVE